MKRPIKRAQVMAEINITPFTDVVLVLLIIFMITTPLMVQQGIKVELPKAQAAEAETGQTINIVIAADGTVFVNEKRVSIDNLKTELTARISHNSQRPVILKADRSIRYDQVVKVIDIAKQSGARKFALGVEVQR